MSFQGKWPIFRTLSKFDLAKSTVDGILEIIEPIIETHRQTLDRDNVRDFLDVMLVEIETSQDSRSPFEPKVGLTTIKNVMVDLFLAGMETTSSSLLHVFLQVLHHPEVQDKIHKELDEVPFILFTGTHCFKTFDL
jgi:cytochrome P450